MNLWNVQSEWVFSSSILGNWITSSGCKDFAHTQKQWISEIPRKTTEFAIATLKHDHEQFHWASEEVTERWDEEKMREIQEWAGEILRKKGLREGEKKKQGAQRMWQYIQLHDYMHLVRGPYKKGKLSVEEDTFRLFSSEYSSTNCITSFSAHFTTFSREMSSSKSTINVKGEK